MERREFLGLTSVAVLTAGCVDPEGDEDDTIDEGETNEQSTSSSSQSEEEADGNEADQSEVYEVHESFEVGNIRYEVADVEVDDTIFIGTSQYSTGSDSEFVKVELEMENTGGEEVEVPYSGPGFNPELEFDMVDGEDRRYTVEQYQVSDFEIGPGLTERAHLAFEVPPDQDSRYLVVDPHRVDLDYTDPTGALGS